MNNKPEILEISQKEILLKLKELEEVSCNLINKYPFRRFHQNIKAFFINLIIYQKISRYDKFFWPNGMLASSLENSYRITKDKSVLKSFTKYYDNWIRKGSTINHLDNIINGYSLIYLNQIKKENKYKETILKAVNYLYKHPVDSMGSLPYRVSSPHDIYIDSIGMICPFLCRYGAEFNDSNAIELAILQLENFYNNGFDINSHLPYHGYNIKENVKYGIIGWGRSIGWFLMGLIYSIEYIDRVNPNYSILVDMYRGIVNKTLQYQLSNGYFTWQIVALEGHIDTSATAMILFAIRKGVLIGILNEKFNTQIYSGILALIKSTQNGTVYDSSSECLGLGMYPQVYGYYPWGQASTTALMALYLNNKSIKD